MGRGLPPTRAPPARNRPSRKPGPPPAGRTIPRPELPSACGGDSNSVGDDLEACAYTPLPGDGLALLLLHLDGRRVKSPAAGGPGQGHFLEEDGRDQGDHEDRAGKDVDVMERV